MPALPWQIESLRKTYFFPLGHVLPKDRLWHEVIDGEPAERTEKPASRSVTESGDWHDHKLQIASQPSRVDLIFHAAMSAPALPNAGAFNDLVGEFRRLSVPNDLGHAIRIAFGASLLVPGTSHEDCYLTLARCLPHVEIAPSSREFQYRINNPKVSAVVAGHAINCISVWSAIKVRFETVPSMSVTELYASRVEVDISTDGEIQLPPGANLDALFDELISCGSTILEKGPTP